MKEFFSKIKQKLAELGKFLKEFFSYWRNWVRVISLIASVVLFCFWNEAYWCRIVAFLMLCVFLLIVSIMSTTFYRTFVLVVEQQKREILENLAEKFNKQEYLKLKTPFTEKEEKFLDQKAKGYKNIMIFCWAAFSLILYVTISLIFYK